MQKIEENMPVSKNALIRYRTIDRCLRNHYRKWTLADLIDACSDALSEYEGRDENVSRRTVQADIQMMRSDKLGYNAPIVVRENRYYTYEDPEYSIADVPLSSQDTELLSEAVGILKQLSGFSALSGIEDIRGHGRVHHLPAGSHSQSRAGEGPSRLRVRNHSPVTAVTRGVHQETPQSIPESVGNPILTHPLINSRLGRMIRMIRPQLDSMTIFNTFLQIALWKSFCKKKVLHIFAESKGNS